MFSQRHEAAQWRGSDLKSNVSMGLSYCLMALAGFSLVACSKEASSPPMTPWADAPQDGQWSAFFEDAVPFGATSPVTDKQFYGPDYTFQILGPPELLTNNDGKTVRISSRVKVNRVRESSSAQSVAGSNKFAFEPGEVEGWDPVDPDLMYGTATRVACDNDVLVNVGESTTCTVSFDAKASEIQDSHWEINNWEMGAWPSQQSEMPPPEPWQN